MARDCTRLGSLGGDETVTFASAINDAGQIVGWSSTAAGKTHAFLTGANGVGMTDLGTLGGENSYANGINNAGQVVGTSDAEGCCVNRAFITGPNGIGMTTFLPTTGAEDPYSSALGISSTGRVVGLSTDNVRSIAGDNRPQRDEQARYRLSGRGCPRHMMQGVKWER